MARTKTQKSVCPKREWEWISVEDGLPDADLEVLCAVLDEGAEDGVDVVPGSCDGEEWRVNGDTDRTVTHWTKLPDPPQAMRAAEVACRSVIPRVTTVVPLGRHAVQLSGGAKGTLSAEVELVINPESIPPYKITRAILAKTKRTTTNGGLVIIRVVPGTEQAVPAEGASHG